MVKGEIIEVSEKKIPTDIPGDYYQGWVIKIHVSSNTKGAHDDVKKLHLGGCEITQE